MLMSYSSKSHKLKIIFKRYEGLGEKPSECSDMQVDRESLQIVNRFQPRWFNCSEFYQGKLFIKLRENSPPAFPKTQASCGNGSQHALFCQETRVSIKTCAEWIVEAIQWGAQEGRSQEWQGRRAGGLKWAYDRREFLQQPLQHYHIGENSPLIIYSTLFSIF